MTKNMGRKKKTKTSDRITRSRKLQMNQANENETEQSVENLTGSESQESIRVQEDADLTVRQDRRPPAAEASGSQSANSEKSAAVQHVYADVHVNKPIRDDHTDNDERLKATSHNADSKPTIHSNTEITPLQIQEIIKTTMQETSKLLKGESSNSYRPIGAFLKICQSKELKFAGETGENLNRFLRKVNDLLATFNFQDKDKINAVGNLLKGRAETWFTTKKSKFASYEAFEDAIRQWHLPEDHEHRLVTLIRSKKQKYNEKLLDFISDVYVCNLDLKKPIEEEELVKCLVLNMHCRYKSLIGRECKKFTTITELEESAKYADEIIIEEESQKAKTKNFLDSKKPKVNEIGEVEEATTLKNEVEVDAFSKEKFQGNREMTCHNCSAPGHFWKNCSKARTVFCKRCGKKGYDEDVCPCNKSPNLNEMVQRAVDLAIKKMNERPDSQENKRA